MIKCAHVMCCWQKPWKHSLPRVIIAWKSIAKKNTVQLRGMRTSKRVPNATWTRSTPGVNAFHFRRAFNERIHWKWRTHSLKLGIVMYIYCVFLNTIIVPFKSMDKGNQKGLTSDKRCVYTFDSLSNYLLDGRVYFFQIEYHNTRRVFSSDNCCFSSNSYFSQANRRFLLVPHQKKFDYKTSKQYSFVVWAARC